MKPAVFSCVLDMTETISNDEDKMMMIKCHMFVFSHYMLQAKIYLSVLTCHLSVKRRMLVQHDALKNSRSCSNSA